MSIQYLMRSAIVCGAFAMVSSVMGAVVPPGATLLNGAGSNGSPAIWTLDNDYSVDSSLQIGGTWNHLIVDGGHNLTATRGNIVVGGSSGDFSLLEIRSGSTVSVSGHFYSGQSTSIANASHYNTTRVTGADARLEVDGNLRVGVGAAWLVTENVLEVSDGGLVVIDADKNGSGDIGVNNHWSYGNSWLKLNGGMVAMWNNWEPWFAPTYSLVSSIKVWDAENEVYERVAAYSGQSVVPTAYYQYLFAEYIDDVAEAVKYDLPSELVGFTVVKNLPIPEPGVGLLLGLGVGGLMTLRHKP